ncbi:MAG TPA: alkaline phosphatase family protein, partial [Longimicrobiales bacterium]|nr:alkaline phosphatase family protein [Longimicrobiales bacterium]
SPKDSAFRRFRRRLYSLYYRIKYFPFHAERRRRREEARRGFLVIQIDALAHEDLLRAIERGYAPGLKRLVEKQGWTIRQYPAGLPSATPAAQAAIFFGTKQGVPGFRWYEKESGRVLVGSKVADVQVMRDRLPAEGVLRGGAGYANIYDGGAKRAVFTLAAREPQPFLEKMGGGRVGLLLLLHPYRLVRLILDCFIQYVREEWERLLGQIRGQYTYYWWYLPFLHIGTNVILRELQTLAVLLDIYVGEPAIYTTYNVYDEHAHHFGPSSRAAYSSVRGVDRRIRQMMRMLRRLPGRPYDVYILSDHGQTPSVPYRVVFGETLGDTIISATRHGVLVMAGLGDYTPADQDAMNFLISELEEVSQTSTRPTRYLGLRLGRWLRSHYNIFPLLAENVKVHERAHVVVTYSSSLAHVYWTHPKRALRFDDIRHDPEKRALYYFLVAHKGIGVVVTRMLDGAHVETIHGRALLTPEGEMEVLEGDNPLRHYAESPADCRALAQLVQQPNGGDLVLFGAYDPEKDECICFDDQVGAHGALGGRQSAPFIMSRPELIPEDYPINDPLDLHPLFARYSAGRKNID